MTEVVITGAGPAGLASAACLARRGLRYTLLERGAAPAAGLRRVDPEMTLFSPARLSRLPGMHLDPGYPSVGQFVAALDCYRAEQKIELTTDAEVTAVEAHTGAFAVAYRDVRGQTRDLRASHVISATGIVSAPRLPADFDPAASSLRWLHSRDVRAEHVAASRRLLVVGLAGRRPPTCWPPGCGCAVPTTGPASPCARPCGPCHTGYWASTCTT